MYGLHSLGAYDLGWRSPRGTHQSQQFSSSIDNQLVFHQVVFVPNYNVTAAELIILASELSQHISTASMEASGTSNMKFALNGCLIIGTLDGANVEIHPRFEEAKQMIRSKTFGDFDYEPLLDSLEGNSGYGCGDYFLVGVDFPSYIEAQKEIDIAYKDRRRWNHSSILSTAGSGKFSSDCTISQYATDIWNIQECRVP
ncbi:unnamed protein product [Sphagnum troendelagicum]